MATHITPAPTTLIQMLDHTKLFSQKSVTFLWWIRQQNRQPPCLLIIIKKKNYKTQLMWAIHGPNQLTLCSNQFKSPGVKILCVLYLHYNVTLTFKWHVNYRNKTCYPQRVWIGYNIELADLVYWKNEGKMKEWIITKELQEEIVIFWTKKS